MRLQAKIENQALKILKEKGFCGPGRRIEIRKDDPFDRNVQSFFKVRCFFLARSDAGPFLFCRRKSVHGMRAELTIS